jgi:hypothetical protein
MLVTFRTAAVLAVAFIALLARPTYSQTLPPARAAVTVPVVFEANRGQFDDGVAYRARTRRGTVTIRDEGSIDVSRPGSPFRLAGSRPVQPVGIDQLAARARYLRGNNPDRWIQDVTLHRAVRLSGVYPGIDWVWNAREQGIEYDFIVQPGAEPKRIALDFGRSARLRIVDGDLRVLVDGGETVHRRPRAYQIVDNVRREVAASWRVRGSRARFALGGYDRRLPLIIDPVLSWSVHVGTAATDSATDVALASDGSIVVAGETYSNPDVTTQDAFIARLTGAGELAYITHFGGSSTEFGPQVAVAGGQVYFTGGTYSTDFPLVAPAQSQPGGGINDAYAGLLGADGGFVFATYLGGSNLDSLLDVVVAADGTAWMTGVTWSANWPTTSPVDGSLDGPEDAVLVHIASSGQLLMSSYLPGGFCEAGKGLSISSDGAIYVGGSTAFFLGTPLPGSCLSTRTGWLLKLAAGGTSVAWARVLTGTESIESIVAIDGSVWTTGSTQAVTLPTTPDAYDSTCGTDGACNGTRDGFLSIRDGDGNPTYGSYLGGAASDSARALASDGNGGVWIVGTTDSMDWPETGSSSDAFVLRFDAVSRRVNYAVRFGGTLPDSAFGVAADVRGGYVIGSTLSPTLPAERNPLAGPGDGFLAHFASLAKNVFIDRPANGARVLPELVIDGWAIDDRSASGAGIDAIHIWAFSLDSAAPPTFLGAAQLGLARPDVAAAYGARYGSSGYRLAATLPGFGRYLIAVYGRSTSTGQFDAVRTVVVTAADLARIALDNPQPGTQVTPPLVVSGWALNPEPAVGQGTGIDGVDVWAFPAAGGSPVFVGAASYGVERPDVAALFGEQFRRSGYQIRTTHLWAGSYTLAAYPHYTGSNRYGAPAVSSVHILAGPQVVIDQYTPIGQPITVSGWALDRRVSSGTGIDHVLVYATRLPDSAGGSGTTTFVGWAEYGQPRPDLANILGAQFLNCGFRLQFTGLASGLYRIGVYAHSVNAPPGSFPYFETWTGTITLQ